MASATIPMSVLADRLKEAVDGRRVRAGVFTTFSFDPGFFELNILPILFDQPFSQPDKVRRLQLEDALRTVDELAVYYDRRALSQDGEPAQLDYRRIDLSRKTGYFHPKVILLLVDEAGDDARDNEGVESAFEEAAGTSAQALVVGVLSANLTRAGWWENVECAHLEEIKDRDVDDERCPFRPDLLSLIRQLRESANPADDHAALEQVRQFLRKRAPRDRVGKRRSQGVYHTRIFCGQGRQRLADWLQDLRLSHRGLNLEVVSPYFDDKGAGPLEALIEAVNPRETRVYLPTEADGSRQVSKETYEAVAEMADWASLPTEVVSRSRNEQAKRLAPRRVHAKTYRLWARDGPDLLLVGSPNLTSAGHSHSASGNLEAAFLADVPDAPKRWWLEPIEKDAVERFAETGTAEDEGLDAVGLDLSFEYDWSRKTLAYRLMNKGGRRFDVATASGTLFFSVDSPAPGKWQLCPTDAAKQVEALLRSSSFLLITHKGQSWRVLVREENMAHRPSLLAQLTPAEILEYWSLLTPAQRAQFIEARVLDNVEGLVPPPIPPLRSRNTLFDRFAGVYHAFGCLQRSVDTAITEGREREADARLLGAKYDSLPSLLQKTLDQQNSDPILPYVTFLCATQLRRELGLEHREFFKAHSDEAQHLDELLGHLPGIRKAVREAVGGSEDFLDWYQQAFLKPVSSIGSGA